MRRVLRAIVMLIFFTALVGCNSSIRDLNSQWRGDEQNQLMLANMYARAIPLCDGKSKIEHEACVKKIRAEYSARFDDRFNAYYRFGSPEELLATVVVISYVSELSKGGGSSKATGASSTSSSASTGTIRKTAVCRTHQFSSSHAISLSSFTVIPVVCN